MWKATHSLSSTIVTRKEIQQDCLEGVVHFQTIVLPQLMPTTGTGIDIGFEGSRQTDLEGEGVCSVTKWHNYF